MARLNRRETLALLSAAGGAGLAAAWGAGSRVLAAFDQTSAPVSPAFPKGAVIRTLLKDLPPEALAGGPVLFHEHLSMHYPPQVKEHFTDDVAMMVEEVRAAGKDGIACIVDGGHPDMTRSLDALKRIATESGVAIVASGGYYMQRTYPPEIGGKSADQIADELTREAAAQRLGAFGEIGQQGGVLTDDEPGAARRRAASARCPGSGGSEAGTDGDRPHLLPRRSEGGGRAAAGEARRVCRVRPRHHSDRSGRRARPHDHGDGGGGLCRSRAAVVRLRCRQFAEEEWRRRHRSGGDRIRTDAAQGRLG